MRSVITCLCIWLAWTVGALAQQASTGSQVTRPKDVTVSLLLRPGPGNPRNSEGSFVTLKDGRILFVYTHFTGGGGDHSRAYLASRVSYDAGKTWSKDDVVVLAKEGKWNVMSVSLLRLASGRIALFYLRKNSLTDCRPCMRLSTDEGKTWSEPQVVIADQVGYYVLNNDRVVQLKNGRLVVPVALHNLPQYEKPDWAGKIMCYLSDDEGKTWHRSKDQLVGRSPAGKRVTLQEPGVVELKDGRLMMFCRASGGFQQVSYSSDRGETWTPFVPSALASPVSPATIKRIPSTGDLLVVWNDHSHVPDALRGRRRPFTAAISKDEGRTWQNVKLIEDKPDGHYCYTAMHFVDDCVLLGHCCGPGLGTTQITRFPVSWLYKGR